MQTKYKLPKYIYQQAIWSVRGQKDRVDKYQREKDNILNSSGASYLKIKNKKGETELVYLPKSKSNQSSTEIKGLALAFLDGSESTVTMHIIEQCLCEATKDYINADEIKTAILNNIEDRHKYPYRNLGNIYISEKTFYNIKSKFLYLVAMKLNIS